MMARASRNRALDVACALGAAAVVAALAALLPRRYMVNDDQTLTAFLRENTLAPYVEPLLSQALGAAYAAVPDTPWFGLWLYGVYAAALALGARMLLDVPARAPRSLRIALLAACAPLALGIAALPLRITFTTAAIAACGIALVGLAHELLRENDGEPLRLGRGLACGLVLAAGLATRTEALGAAGVAAFPLLVAAAWRALRAGRRRLPVRLLLAGSGPAVTLYVLGWVAPQWRDPEARRYLAFNAECNALQLRAAFVDLDRRAPEVLKAAGWDVRRYRRFMRWAYLDERWYTTERLRALRETGGRSRDLEPRVALTRARLSAGYAFPLFAFSALAAGGLALCGLGRSRALTLGLAQLLSLVLAAALLQRWLRFPVRVALPMTLVAAMATWVAVRADCDLARWEELRTRFRKRPLGTALTGLGLALALACALVSLARERPRPAAVPDARSELERRVEQRLPALVVVHAQAGWNRDPLRARPRDYPYLSLDWDIFSAPFYRALARVGASRGFELAHRMAAADDVYLLSERRFLADVTSLVDEDAPGTRLEAVDGSGPTADDLVLLRAVRAPHTGEGR